MRQNLHFDYYDKIVCDAVSTLWTYYKSSNLKNDQVKINVNAVLACMSGNDTIRLKKGATSSKRESHLIDILEKLGNTEICIDQRKELSLRKSSDIGGIQGVYSGYILPVKRMEHTNDFLLDLTKEPPFYAYASNKNQVISLKMQYLTCKEELPKAQKGKKRISLSQETQKKRQMQELPVKRTKARKNTKEKKSDCHPIRTMYYR